MRWSNNRGAREQGETKYLYKPIGAAIANSTHSFKKIKQNQPKLLVTESNAQVLRNNEVSGWLAFLKLTIFHLCT